MGPGFDKNIFMSLSRSRKANEVSDGTVVRMSVVDPSVCDQPCAVGSSTGDVGSKARFQTANCR